MCHDTKWFSDNSLALHHECVRGVCTSKISANDPPHPPLDGQPWTSLPLAREQCDQCSRYCCRNCYQKLRETRGRWVGTKGTLIVWFLVRLGTCCHFLFGNYLDSSPNCTPVLLFLPDFLVPVCSCIVFRICFVIKTSNFWQKFCDV